MRVGHRIGIGLLCARIGACATTSSEGAFVPLDRYLSQFGIANLPPLSVEYSNGSSTVSLHGNATVIFNDAVSSAFLRSEPSVTWTSQSDSLFSLFFVDLGPDTGTHEIAKAHWTPRPFFPFVHSLWTRCTSSLATCQQVVKPYLKPGNVLVVPNRYTWLLFQHASSSKELRLHGRPAFDLATNRRLLKAASTAFSFARLLRENPGLRATAYNFMNVRGNVSRRRKRVGRRLSDAQGEAYVRPVDSRRRSRAAQTKPGSREPRLAAPGAHSPGEDWTSINGVRVLPSSLSQ